MLTIVTGDDSTTCDALSTAVYSMSNDKIQKIKNRFKKYDITTYK